MSSDLAERLAPRLYGMLEHPELGSVMSPIAGLNAATMPAGMAEDMAKDAGIPEPNIALMFLECVVHLLETEGGVELVDRAQMADLRAAAGAQEHKRNHMMAFTTRCGQTIRVMARGFDNDTAQVPCALVVHECGAA